MLTWLKQRKSLVLAVVLMLVAFLAGRWTGAPRTVTVDRTDVTSLAAARAQVTVLQAQVETSRHQVEATRAELARVTTQDRERHQTVTVTKPDGTRIERRTEDISRTRDERTVTVAQQATIDDKAIAVTKATTTATETVAETHRTEQHTTSDPLPRLMLGLGLGVSVPTLLGGTADRQLIPILPRAALGIASLNVRLLGRTWVGAWATTGGAVGLQLLVGVR